MLSKISLFFKELQLWTLIAFGVTVPFSKALANIFIVATAVTWALNCILDKKIYFPRSPFNWIICLFILSLSLSFTQTNSLELSIEGISKVLQRLGFFFLGFQVFTIHQDKLNKVLGWLSVGFGTILLSGIVQLIDGHDFLRGRLVTFISGGLPRLTSSFEYPDQFGIYLIFGIFLFGYALLGSHTSKGRKIYFLILVLVAIIELTMTHSRASWVALFGGIIFSSLFFKRALLSFMGTLGVLTILLIVTPSSLLIHENAQGKEQSASERFTLWDRAFNLIESQPITGVGINTYTSQADLHRTDESDNLLGYYAHNSFLQLGAESGLPSLALFLTFLLGSVVWGLVILKKQVSKSLEIGILRACLAGAVSFYVMNIFETSFFSVQPSLIFYFFLALMYATAMNCKNVRGS
jgi:O-antigen ligase